MIHTLLRGNSSGPCDMTAECMLIETISTYILLGTAQKLHCLLRRHTLCGRYAELLFKTIPAVVHGVWGPHWSGVAGGWTSMQL